jgi:hypothetical protein
MPEKSTIEKARRDEREGKAPSTQAGEFVHEEIEHIREGKHGARSAKQAIAIGLSKARRAGVRLPPPQANASLATRKKAERDLAIGSAAAERPPLKPRSRATTKALEREGSSAASSEALSRQARKSARGRSAVSRKRAAQKAVRTKRNAARGRRAPG